MERRRSFSRVTEQALRLRSGEEHFNHGALNATLDEAGWHRALRPHQQEFAALAMTAINVANFSVPGAGKTAATLAVAAAHMQLGTVDLVVVVGPLASFEPWERETQVCLGARATTRRVRGNKRERLAVYASARPWQILVLSYATAAADQRELIELCSSWNVMLIVDESHRVKRFRGGLWAPALTEVAKSARVRHVLSGTPMPQSGKDLFSQANIMWPDQQLTGNRDAFAAAVDQDFGRVASRVHPFAHRTPKAALGLPDYEVHSHSVPLVGTQAEVYEYIEGRFRRELNDAATWQDKIAAMRRGRPIRLLQAAANPDLLNGRDSYFNLPALDEQPTSLMERLATYARFEVPAKSLAALDLIEQIAAANGKVVCWSNFVPNLDQFSRLARARFAFPVLQIDGRVPAGTDSLHEDMQGIVENAGEVDTRERIIDRFLNVDGPSVLVTNPASCSESISLHSTCHNAIYLDRTYDCALFLQSIDRIHRLGLPPEATVRIHVLCATVDGRMTVDGLVGSSLRQKSDAMRQLLEGAELSPIGLSDDPSVDAEGSEDDLESMVRFLLGEEMRS
ncbi:MAG: DEAD/DEAH box helicase [Sphingomonadales bacterium]|nr:DEAD/DEAH box helicase [Sphingomonadales bacterium]